MRGVSVGTTTGTPLQDTRRIRAYGYTDLFHFCTGERCFRGFPRSGGTQPHAREHALDTLARTDYPLDSGRPPTCPCPRCAPVERHRPCPLPPVQRDPRPAPLHAGVAEAPVAHTPCRDEQPPPTLVATPA